LGVSLNAWTVNDPADMDWLIAHRFNYITTNEPELLLGRLANAPVAKGWQLSWSDEFNYHGLPDTNKWAYETGGNGWGNNELQYYTGHDTSNAKVNNGQLHIVALKQPVENRQYSSARLVTKNKAEFTYGLIEVRAKLPVGKGTWPAIWMLGKNIDKAGWPECGEIDIMEHVGYQPDSIFGTVHTQAYNHVKGTQKTRAIYIPDPYTAFHVYSIEWTPEKIDFMVDGVLYNHVLKEHRTTQEWPFDQPFYLILNLAIGGNWGGKMGVDDQIFPATMEIDYVRVYEQGKAR